MQLHVDTVWCSKCKMCRAGSGGKIKFRDDGYPAEGKVADRDLEQIRAAVACCLAGALGLSGDRTRSSDRIRPGTGSYGKGNRSS